MRPTLAGQEPSRGPAAGQRLAALVWALLHTPLFLALFAPGIAAAIRSAPGAYRAALWPTFLPQATLLALVAFALGLPFSVSGRAYRVAAPAATALVTAGLALDARIYESVGFHLNGFFLRFLLQPNALTEAGVPKSDVAIFLGLAALFAAASVAAGAWFIRRFAGRRRAWPLALALVLLSVGERVYGTGLTFFGGPAFFAASTVLPLQPPVRWNGLWVRVFGERAQKDPFARAGASKRLPSGLPPGEVKLTRTPDVLFVVAESLPAAHLDART